ncbi:peptide chain release factor N(5)-glutamine methyltransferase [Patescibacteria group bacterium]|nr:peptide chain release factor N(5)-glutamine methyltransferase [Patescibacteria group bacterium]MBU1028925.1 peptide chain release factor N(5)-glutamine methyltransferase [Patescibacteria group bacterium]MBU1916218.1 peptide chain release factor N(5)-glutamine methyltransferase [Patescibacteria group bacterium]
MESILQTTIERLRMHICEGVLAEQEAAELLTFVTGRTRDQIQRKDFILNTTETNHLNNLIERRLRHEPLAYLLGTAYFLGRKFIVTPDVLVPRPATEIIVTKLITDQRDQDTIIIDVGTGSGCAAISIALELPLTTVIATDSSVEALTVARTNAELLTAINKVQFLTCDLLPDRQTLPADLKLLITDRRAVIFANLPYIPTTDMSQLAPDVRDFEPHLALDGGVDGLDLYRQLFEQLAARPHSSIRPRSLYLEALPAQLDQLENLAKEKLPILTTKKIYADSANQLPIGLILHIT